MSSESLLSTPLNNIRSITVNGQSFDKNLFRDGVSNGFTFPYYAGQYLIEVNFQFPTTIDRLGILASSSDTNVDIFETILNQNPEYPRQTGRVNEMIVSNASNKLPSVGASFLIVKTNNGQPPKNIALRIEGCNPLLPSTKAQIEQSTTSSSASV